MSAAILRVACIGLSADDLARFKAIMAAAISGRKLNGCWHMGDAAGAQLIITSPSRAADVARDASRNPDGMLAALVGEADELPAGFLSLLWPLRLSNVITILNDVERRVAASSTAATPLADGAQRLLRLAQLLRSSAESTDCAWRVDGLAGSTPFTFSPQRKELYYTRSLHSIRGEHFDSQFVLTEVTHSDPSVRADIARPLYILQWIVGLQLGHTGLLPWLDADATFKLARFPNFQMLHHLPVHRQLASALAKPRAGMQVLIDQTGVNAATVAGFLNATELCGYLQTRAHPAATRSHRSSHSSLVRMFRKALGMVPSDG